MGSSMIEEALACLEEADTFTAVEFLNQQPQPTDVAAAYNEILKVLFWKKRDINAVIALGRAGIQYSSDRAEAAAASGDMEQSYTLRSAAKQLSYNVASYTWPGWNETGVILNAVQVAAGLDAARQNLRLALELDKPDLALSRAYWMLGGHLLAAGTIIEAEAHYGRAQMYAHRAGEEAEEALSEAFCLLAYWLLDRGREERRRSYETARGRLSAYEDGPAFQQQLDNAKMVFVDENGGRLERD